MPLEIPQFIEQAIEHNQEAAVLHALGFDDEHHDDAGGTQGGAPQQGWASGLVNGVAANISAVLFSPAVESQTTAPVPRPTAATPSGILFSPAVESPAQTPASPGPPSSTNVPDLTLQRSSAVDTGENNEGGDFDEKERVSVRTQSSKRHEKFVGGEIRHDRIIMLFFFPARSFFLRLLLSVFCSFFSQNLLIWVMSLSETAPRYFWAETGALWKDRQMQKMK